MNETTVLERIKNGFGFSGEPSFLRSIPAFVFTAHFATAGMERSEMTLFRSRATFNTL